VKRPKQYIVSASGCHVGVTFTPVEEARVRKKAARLGLSVEELIGRAIDKRARHAKNIKRPVDELIPQAIKGLAAPIKRKSTR
jgi:DUF917 family protein